MLQPLTKTFNLCSALIIFQLLISCGWKSSNKTPKLLINNVNQSAITYKAQYGIDYEIHGNVIARYPHFNLTLFSQRSIRGAKRVIHIYEITSTEGFEKTHITCDPRRSEKKHFSLEGLHFYYHSNSDGSINIYMPEQLLAKS